MEELRARCSATITTPDVSEYAWETAAKTLTKHFGVASLRGFGCEEMPLAMEAAGLLLRYLQQTQKTTVGQIRSLSTYSLDDLMLLDASTRRNLELIASLRDGGRMHSLLWVLDQTRTAMGARLLKKWLLAPLLTWMTSTAGWTRWRPFARMTCCARKCAKSCAAFMTWNACSPAPPPAPAMRATWRNCATRSPSFPACSPLLEDAAPVLQALVEGADTLPDLRETLAAALVDSPPISVRDGGMIRPGYNAELDTLRRATTEGKDWIAALEATERERTGIKSLKVGYNNVFGYYIEISRTNLELVPARLYPQADAGQRRTLHHPGAEGIRGDGAGRGG